MIHNNIKTGDKIVSNCFKTLQDNRKHKLQKLNAAGRFFHLGSNLSKCFGTLQDFRKLKLKKLNNY